MLEIISRPNSYIFIVDIMDNDNDNDNGLYHLHSENIFCQTYSKEHLNRNLNFAYC